MTSRRERGEPSITAYPEGSGWRYDLKLHDHGGRTTGPMRRIETYQLLRTYGLTDNQIANRLKQARRRHRG